MTLTKQHCIPERDKICMEIQHMLAELAPDAPLAQRERVLTFIMKRIVKAMRTALAEGHESVVGYEALIEKVLWQEQEPVTHE